MFAESGEEEEKRVQTGYRNLKQQSQTNSLGVTPEYNRSLYDDETKKRKYREKTFDGRKIVIDEITGETLHLNRNAAKNKYKQKAWADHVPETDHITSLYEIHTRTKGNPFLTDNDIKEIANQDLNYRVTTKRFNGSKQQNNDFVIACKGGTKRVKLSSKGRKNLIKQKTLSEMKINLDLAARTGKNLTGEFIKGADNSLSTGMAILVEGATNSAKVLCGQKNAKEAIQDTVTATANCTVHAGLMQVNATAIEGILKNSGSIQLDKIVTKSHIMQMVSIGNVLTESFIELINDDINAEGFFEKINQSAIGVISSEIGFNWGVVIAGTGGAALVPVVTSIIISTACVGVYQSIMQQVRASDSKWKKQCNALERLAQEAILEINKQKEQLQVLMDQQFIDWDNNFKSGFEKILQSACEENSAEKIAEGINQILNVFEKKVRFESSQDFYAAFSDENFVLNM